MLIASQVNAPTLEATPIQEDTPGYIARAFPTLFPNGAGDFHTPRMQKVDMGEYFDHLMHFHDGRFARHRRFPWFAFNTLQRRRSLGAAKVYSRGSGHIHGFLWLDGAPNPDDIDWETAKKPEAVISDEQQTKIAEFISYWKQFISAWNPFPNGDDNQPLVGQHPSSVLPSDMKFDKQELATLLNNWVQHHRKCRAGYCLVKQKIPGSDEKQECCRFDFPKPLRDDDGWGTDSKGRPQYQPKRKSPSLNAFIASLIMGWLGNFDFNPVFSTYYISKYATKAETGCPAFTAILNDIVNAVEGNTTARSICQKLLNKMIGERTYPVQETIHLLLGIPLVRSTFSFTSLNLSSDSDYREVDTSNDADLEVVTGPSWMQRYMNRAPELETLSMFDIWSQYRWYGKKWNKRKEGTTVVVRIFPRHSPNPDDERYEAYCRVKILSHHPFRTINDLIQIKDVNGETVERTWEELFKECQQEGHIHPKDSLRLWEHEMQGEAEGDETDDDEDVAADDEGY
ncbi:hypothetical protein EV360DRAFT_52211, partial [Lentinula raphanica]